MKKSLLLLLPLLIIALLASCGSKPKGSKGSKDGGVDGKIIKDERYGYSVLVPDEFEHGKGGGVHSVSASSSAGSDVENDEQCKGFSCDEYEYEICTNPNPHMPLKQSFEMHKSSYRNAEAKMLDDESFFVIGEDGSKLQAFIEFQKKGISVTIRMGYPIKEKEEFKEVVDAVIDSFEMK